MNPSAIDLFFSSHLEGDIRFVSFTRIGKDFCLLMADYSFSSVAKDVCHEFYGDSLSNCIGLAQVWIDSLIQEDRDATERARDEQDDGDHETGLETPEA